MQASGKWQLTDKTVGSQVFWFYPGPNFQTTKVGEGWNRGWRNKKKKKRKDEFFLIFFFRTFQLFVVKRKHMLLRLLLKDLLGGDDHNKPYLLLLFSLQPLLGSSLSSCWPHTESQFQGHIKLNVHILKMWQYQLVFKKWVN